MPKGSKTCSNCGEITGPRSYECPKCKNPFTIKHKFTKPPGGNVVNEVKAPETPSPSSITINTTNPGPVVDDGKPKMKPGYWYVYTPGKNPSDPEPFCPIKLKDPNDEKSIREWINKLADYRFQLCGRTTIYTRQAIKYFGLDYWPMYLKEVIDENPDYTKFCKMVDEELVGYV